MKTSFVLEIFCVMKKQIKDIAPKTTDLWEVVNFLDSYCELAKFKDYDRAKNGLQAENSGKVARIATSVDAGLGEIKIAAHLGVDLLIVHHGMFWNPPIPFVNSNYEKIKTLIDSDIAVYSVHLPLDAHSKIGNNALIAKALGLKKLGTCFEYGGENIGVLAAAPKSREELEASLKNLFPTTFKAIRYGSKTPKKVAICSGGSEDSLGELISMGVDTFICGELRQHHFVLAQEVGLNLYPCGHYATERFGVMALGEVVAQKFGLDCSFIEMPNPL